MTPSEPPDPVEQDRSAAGTPPPEPPYADGRPGAAGRFRPRMRRAVDPWQLWIRRAEAIAATRAEHMPMPAWMRTTPGERRWPVTLTVIVAITLQLLLPPHLTGPLPRWVLPTLEGGC